MHCRVFETEEGCYLEMLERRGRLVHSDRISMLESFVRFLGQFRDDHSKDDVRTHESELWQYGSADVVLRCLMQSSFCVGGSVSQRSTLVNISAPQLSSENMSSVVLTILSWCQSRGVRSPHSIPDNLVSERSDAVGRAIDPDAVSLEDLWDEVGRESTNGYRESVFERMGPLSMEIEKAVQKLEVNIDFEDFDIFILVQLCS